MMAPVHPMPTMTASTFGCITAMCLTSATCQVDRRQGVGLVADFDPVRVVSAHTRVADHLPRAHALIAAVHGIGEVAVTYLRQQLGKEDLGRDSLELQLAGLGGLEHRFLLSRLERCEGLAVEL